MEWMLMPYRRYADFEGRSCRKEYWMFTLLSVLVAMVAVTLMVMAGAMMGGDETQFGPLFWLGIALILIFTDVLYPKLNCYVERRYPYRTGASK